MTAPFPWFGGKRRVAELVWERLGRPGTYLEPFAGSLAMLLAGPPCPNEIVNDADGMIVNFWRAAKWHPDQLAAAVDWPTTELDMHARNRHLIEVRPELAERLRANPRWCDPELAGWWCWGQQIWIGGVYAANDWQSIPDVTTRAPGRKGYDYQALAERLAGVRVTCGNWTRILAPKILKMSEITGIFLDPPYAAECVDLRVYAEQDTLIARGVTDWCIRHGRTPGLRIAVCGYEGEHNRLDREGWSKVAWSTKNAQGARKEGRFRNNSDQERIWFSPGCLLPFVQLQLFGDTENATEVL